MGRGCGIRRRRAGFGSTIAILEVNHRSPRGGLSRPDSSGAGEWAEAVAYGGCGPGTAQPLAQGGGSLTRMAESSQIGI